MFPSTAHASGRVQHVQTAPIFREVFTLVPGLHDPAPTRWTVSLRCLS